MRYDQLIIIDEEKRKEWDEMDPKIKKTILNNLQKFTDEMEVTLSIQLLSNIIVDMNKRLCDLENKVFQEGKDGGNCNKEG